MSKPRHISDVRALARRALAAGGRVNSASQVVSWDVSGDCSNPRVMAHTGREAAGAYYADLEEGGDDRWHISPHLVVLGTRSYYADRPDRRKSGQKGHSTMWVDITVRCRQCPSCLRQRAREWAARAIRECAAAPRTWFGTITLTASEHDRVALRAVKALYGAGIDFDKLSAEQQFRERVREITPEITLWLKRIRKESGAKLRYILVAEAHKSGLPHFHLLVHEVQGSQPVKYKTLGSQWKLGFTQFKLVSGTGTAWYVCKYLSKSALSRVRASVGYGTTAVAIDPQGSWKSHPPKSGGSEF